jgi:excisionase family DNA binding protein
MEEYLTLDELAAWLKLSKSNVRRLAAERTLPGVKIGRLWRFARGEVEAWLKEQGQRRVAEAAGGLERSVTP